MRMTTLEKIEVSKTYSKSKITKKQKEIVNNLLEDTPSKHKQFFIDFILGYLKNKPKALKEDLQHAIDVASFYKEKPERFDLKNRTPIELAEKHFQELATALNEHRKSKNKSEIQNAKRNGKLIDGISVEIKYQDDEYKVYFIPALRNGYSEEELDIQHLKFCYVGHETRWCTAHADGSYYQKYATHDIYTIHKNEKPFAQFNIVCGKIKQMMDVKDESLNVLSKKTLIVLNKALNND